MKNTKKDDERIRKITLIVLLAFAVFITGPMLHAYSYNQTDFERDRMSLAKLEELNAQKATIESLINYCFQHADRPNPLEDLLDKGFLSETFRGETCLSIKDMHIQIVDKIAEQDRILGNAMQNMNDWETKKKIMLTCMENKSNSYEDCEPFLNGTKKWYELS